MNVFPNFSYNNIPFVAVLEVLTRDVKGGGILRDDTCGRAGQGQQNIFLCGTGQGRKK